MSYKFLVFLKKYSFILRNYLVFFFYLIISILYFFLPIAHKFNSQLISDGDPDASSFLWFLGWWPFALFHNLNPFISHYIWVPDGFNLTVVASIPAPAILGAPLTWMFGAITTYNIWALLAPTLASFSFFLLSLELVEEFYSSIICGYFFGFSCYMLCSMVNAPNLYLIFPVPLFLWITMRRVKGKITNIQFILYSWLTLLLQFGISTEIFTTGTFFCLIIFVLIIIFYYKKYSNHIFLFIKEMIIVCLLFSLSVGIFMYYFIKDWNEYTHLPNPPQLYSADLLNYFIPSPITWLGAKIFVYTSKIFNIGIYGRDQTYIGLPFFLIAIFSVIKHFKDKRILIISLVTLSAFMFSFGPVLHIAGKEYFKMPWSVFLNIPILPAALPVRFSMFALLGISILVAFIIKENKRKIVASLLLLTLISTFPNFQAKAWDGNLYIPNFFHENIKKYINKNDIVLILPFGYIGTSMSWQEESGFYFRMAGGYVGQAPGKFLNNNHLLYSYKILTGEMDPPSNYQEDLKYFIRYSNIKYVILVKKAKSLRGNEKKWKDLVSFLGKPIDYNDVLIFPINQKK